MLRELATCQLRLWPLLVAWLLPGLPAFAQRQIESRLPPLGLDEGLRHGRALVADLLAQRPAQDATNSGVLRIRNEKGAERTVPVRFAVFSTPSNWVSLFETRPKQSESAGERLTVIHSNQRPDEYFLSALPEKPGTNSPPVIRAGEQMMMPFAASDFWLADLALQFLNWPRQRVLRTETRHSQPCDVLESTNPSSGPGGYCRVVSWVDTQNGGLVHADAYDSRGRLLKQFDPKSLKRVRGEFQLQEIEMRNVQTGSRSFIKFDL